MVRILGTLITRNTVGPMVGVKVSKEGSTIVNSVNTFSLGRIQAEREIKMQCNPGWKAFDKDIFYIGTTVPNLQKKKKKKIKKKINIYIYIK